MLATEEACYIQEIEDQKETVLERQAKMRERAKFLKDKRESERLSFVQQKYDQQFRFVVFGLLFSVGYLCLFKHALIH